MACQPRAGWSLTTLITSLVLPCRHARGRVFAIRRLAVYSSIALLDSQQSLADIRTHAAHHDPNENVATTTLQYIHQHRELSSIPSAATPAHLVLQQPSAVSFDIIRSSTIPGGSFILISIRQISALVPF